MLNKLGKIIVFEGADASGKGTQSQLLFELLKSQNIKCHYLDFPQYESFYGKLVAKFLRGELGKLQDVSPYFAALAFALDRYAVKDKIDSLLKNGYIIIANRYVTSNIAHQAVKFSNKKDQTEFIEFVKEMEYNVNNLKKEDVVIFLDIPADSKAELLKKKDSRKYLKNMPDIQEEDTKHQQDTILMYKKLCAQNKNWIKINCIKNKKLKDINEIHSEIIQALKKLNIL